MTDTAISLEEAWETCRDLYEGLTCGRETPDASIEEELLFCLLGGFGVSYELNVSAADAVAQLHPFDTMHAEDDLREQIELLLSAPRFEPRRSNGSLRRYRFPARKAAVIIAARRWVHSQPALKEALSLIPTEKQRRAYLCECPGVGPKTSSWLLRNLGFARELAILDVHLVRALLSHDRVASSARLPRDYEMVEAAFLQWCTELDADPAAFDLFVWEWQRGALS